MIHYLLEFLWILRAIHETVLLFPVIQIGKLRPKKLRHWPKVTEVVSSMIGFEPSYVFGFLYSTPNCYFNSNLKYFI